jgi:hypothetical protein
MAPVSTYRRTQCDPLAYAIGTDGPAMGCRRAGAVGAGGSLQPGEIGGLPHCQGCRLAAEGLHSERDYLADTRALGLWKSARRISLGVRMFSEIVRKLSRMRGQIRDFEQSGSNANRLRSLSRFEFLEKTPDSKAVTTHIWRGFAGPELESLSQHHMILYDIYCLML